MRRGALAAVYVCIFFDFIGFGMIVPNLPAVARSLGANDFLAPQLGAAFYLMQLLFAPFWGRVSDRIGRRPVLMMSFAGSLVGMLGLGFTSSLWVAFAVRLWTGAVVSHVTVSQAYVCDLMPPERRAWGIGLVGVALGMGVAVGSGMAVALLDVRILHHALALPALIAAGLSLVNITVVAGFVRESLTGVPAAVRAAAARPAAPETDGLGSLARAARFPGVALTLVVAFLFFTWFGAMEQTLVNFTHDAFSMSLNDTNRIFAFVGVTGIVVQAALLHPLVRRFGEPALIIAGCTLAGVGLLMAPLSPTPGSLFGAAFFVAVGAALTIPCCAASVSRRSDAASQGVALGAVNAATSLARVVGPVIAGALYHGVGRGGPYYAGFVGMLVAAALALKLPPLVRAAASLPPTDHLSTTKKAS